MKLLDWLRKLGIFRFGVEKGIYHNAQERPLGLQMGDVFNTDKDIIEPNKLLPKEPLPLAKKA